MPELPEWKAFSRGIDIAFREKCAVGGDHHADDKGKRREPKKKRSFAHDGPCRKKVLAGWGRNENMVIGFTQAIANNCWGGATVEVVYDTKTFTTC